jgi:hypothetical protein
LRLEAGDSILQAVNMNKDLAIEIVDRLEELHLENLAMLAYINGIHRLNPKAPTASQLIEAELQNSGSVAEANTVFAPLRTAFKRIRDGKVC